MKKIMNEVDREGDELAPFRDTTYHLSDGSELRFHINVTVGCNTWRNGHWVRFDEGTAAECLEALKQIEKMIIPAPRLPTNGMKA